MTDSEHLYDLLKDFDTAMLITRRQEGHLHARPMAVAELRADADAYFVTSIESPKVAEIEADADVLLTFHSASQYAAVQGKADPSIVLLRFDAEHGEFWDNAGARGLKYVFEAAKAYVKGESPKMDRDQHGRMRL